MTASLGRSGARLEGERRRRAQGQIAERGCAAAAEVPKFSPPPPWSVTAARLTMLERVAPFWTVMPLVLTGA